jgi:DNA processing protein
LPELARRGGRPGSVRICSAAEADAEMAALASRGARLVVLGDRDYPPQLAAIEDAPATLAVIGDKALPSRPCIAVVGSRNASLNGRTLARDLARALGAAGFVVVSGLARGVDAEAHRGALASGTVAVLAGGVDVCYPRENVDLYASVAERGALLSEAPPGMAPQARHFPRRNRLISGLSRGVLVVEANLRSGSLITARTAAEQGREVFAVPGSPLDPRARGCNDLIRQGATLTESAADVLAALGSSFTPPPAAARMVAIEPAAPADDGAGADEARRAVAEMLSPAPVAVDEIIRTCQLSPALVSTILLEWELAGRLERHPGNRVSSIA